MGIQQIESWYFETSAVNHLFKLFSQDDQYSSIKTKEIQIAKGRKWYISSVVLLEIFKTKNQEQRYKLFDFCRYIFYDNLIVSPEEIIINYINAGCPLIEDFYCLNSSNDSLFTKEWRKSCQDKGFMFQLDAIQLEEHISILHWLGKYLYKTQKGYELNDTQDIINNCPLLQDQLILTRLEYLVNELLKKDCESTEDKQILELTFYLALIIVCLAITINNDLVELFWQKLNIDMPLLRMQWLLENRVALFFRGPLRNMAKMMFLQATGKYSRGSIFDSFQSVYITYCHLYLTADKHFIEFKNNIDDPNLYKIYHTDEIKLGRSPIM